MNRRTYLQTTAGVATLAFAGCGDTGSDDDYQSGNGGDATDTESGGGDTPTATTTAEATEAIELLDHELVTEETDYGTTDVLVRGTLQNVSDEMVNYVEVNVRVLNDDGQQLGTYMTNTTDLAAGREWPFEVDLYDREPGEIAEYEIRLDWSQY